MIYSLDTNENVPKNLVGEKAYHLMQLKHLGLNVPSGFVLSTLCFERYMGGNSVSEIVNSLPDLNSKKLMVRSSAVGEDGKEHSFAGQLESFQVDNDKTLIFEKIEACWNSIHNERVEVYDRDHELKTMGVIIQEMIEPDYAGVYFTSSPLNPEVEMLEYVAGHCEKLVQGEVTPETYTSDQSPDDLPFHFKDLQKLAHIIRNFYQNEQDIEWCYKQGVFYIVQARPITKLTKKIKWSSTNVNENYPNKLSPLLYSIARRSYYHYFKNLASRLGVKTPSENEYLFANIIGEWGERMYYNMTHIHMIINFSPLGNLLKNSFDHFVGYQKESKKNFGRNSIFSKTIFTLRALMHYFGLERHVKTIEHEVDAYLNETIEHEALPRLYHQFLDLRFNRWFHASFADFFAMATHGALGKFLEFLKISDAQGVQNNLIQSIPNLVSNKPIFELWEIKKTIKDENLLFEFLEKDSSELLELLKNDQSYKNISYKIDFYLKNWGARCTGELTFLDKNYIEDPKSFLSMLKMYLKSSSQDPKEQFDKKHLEQKELLAKTIKNISNQIPIVRWSLQKCLKFLVEMTMTSIAARERVRLKQALMYFKFKQVVNALGSKLEESQKLKNAQDIFFLEYDEIARILNSEEVDFNYIQELIFLRRNKWEKAIECPENIMGSYLTWDNSFLDQDSTIISDLKGLPACGGVIKARAVVLDSIHQIDQLQKGDILVTKQTDPGWICAFPIISGLVVERGGMLSHGAIVAREFGIPAVVGIKGITQKIKTNDVIEVDGNRGIINV